MIYNVYDRGGRNTEPYVATLLADEESDFQEIDTKFYSPGTSILVIDTGAVYMLNSEKEWIPLGDGGGGGGGGDHSHTASQITYNPTGTTLVSTNVQLAINELWTLIESGGISGLHFIKVSSLPAPASADTTGIYLVDTNVNNIYEMWIVDVSRTPRQWIQLGETAIDFSNYYTKTEINTLLADKQNKLTFDSAPTQNSTNPVTSGGVYTALGTKQDTLTFDNAPTENSNNPVKSGGIYTALGTKQDTLTFDNTPTENSNNPVTSDGIYDALADKQDVLTFDNVPTENSNNPVTSDGIYDALADKQDVLTFDNSPTENSTNPVKSGGVYTALAGKEDTLTWDTTPTENSTNPVTSGGIYDALQNITPPGDANHRDLTQVQYDALSSAEKNNGTEYFITDANADGDFSAIENRVTCLENDFIAIYRNGNEVIRLYLANMTQVVKVDSNTVEWYITDPDTHRNFKVTVVTQGSGTVRTHPQVTVVEVV